MREKDLAYEFFQALYLEGYSGLRPTESSGRLRDASALDHGKQRSHHSDVYAYQIQALLRP